MDSLTETNFGNDNNVLLTCNDITGLVSSSKFSL